MRGLLSPPAGRLLAATFALLIALAISSWLILANAARGYSDELTQRLNRNIAMYVVAEGALIRQGRVNDAQLTRLAHQAMVINPMAEVYLLDATGKIIGHRIKARLAAEAVDLAPVRAFLSQPSFAPIYGSDPRDARARRVFSAAEIREASRLEGYVYVVLGGISSETAAMPIAGSYILSAALITLLVVSLLAAAAAFALTAWLTRPVRELHARVLQLGDQHSDTTRDPAAASEQTRAADLQSVRNAIESLASRLAAQVEELKQADRLRRDLYASVSHDLRTPLTAMRGYLDTLASEDRSLSPERRRSYMEIAVKHCERLTRLVDQVFSLARLDATTVRLRPESVAATELAQDVVTKFQGFAERAGVRLRLEVDPHAPPVMADIGMLETVLQNLIDNAVRHTSAGGEVVVAVRSRPDAVEIIVHDTGCGIPASEIERLMRPNEIGAGGRTGLGLAIVKRVLDLHGTELHVTSDVGVGTTAAFTMTTQPATPKLRGGLPAAHREEVVTIER
jgi:two-component system, OmpR family, sensor kinase